MSLLKYGVFKEIITFTWGQEVKVQYGQCHCRVNVLNPQTEQLEKMEATIQVVILQASHTRIYQNTTRSWRMEGPGTESSQCSRKPALLTPWFQTLWKMNAVIYVTHRAALYHSSLAESICYHIPPKLWKTCGNYASYYELPVHTVPRKCLLV